MPDLQLYSGATPFHFDYLFPSGSAVNGNAYTGDVALSNNGILLSGSAEAAVTGGLIPVKYNAASGASLIRKLVSAYLSFPNATNIRIVLSTPDDAFSWDLENVNADKLIFNTDDHARGIPDGWKVKLIVTGAGVGDVLDADGRAFLGFQTWMSTSGS